MRVEFQRPNDLHFIPSKKKGIRWKDEYSIVVTNNDLTRAEVVGVLFR